MRYRIDPDKWKHFFLAIPLGIAIELFVFEFLPPFNDLLLSSIFSLIIIVIICYGFELFSKVTGKGHYEMMDAIAGILGGIIGIAATLLILYNSVAR